MNETVSMDEYDDVCRELEATQRALATARAMLEGYRGDKAFLAMQEALEAAWHQYSKDVLDMPENIERAEAFLKVWNALNKSKGIA